MKKYMRTIKFRAWDLQTGKMYPVYQMSLVDSGAIRLAKNTTKYDKNIWQSFGEVKVMQFTSLLDKVGKEVWEGDYLRTDDGDESCLCKIVWSANKAGYEIFAWCGGEEWANCFDDIYLSLSKDDKLDDFEVIGNIYENPELLNIKE